MLAAGQVFLLARNGKGPLLRETRPLEPQALHLLPFRRESRSGNGDGTFMHREAITLTA